MKAGRESVDKIMWSVDPDIEEYFVFTSSHIKQSCVVFEFETHQSSLLQIKM